MHSLINLGRRLLHNIGQLLGHALRDLAQLTQRLVGLNAREGAGQASDGILVPVVVLGGQGDLRMGVPVGKPSMHGCTTHNTNACSHRTGCCRMIAARG